MNSVNLAGNEMWRVAGLFGCILFSLLIGRVARFYLTRISSLLQDKGRSLEGAIVSAASGSVLYVALVVGLSQGIHFLALSEKVSDFFSSILGVIWALVIGYICYRLVDVLDEWLKRSAARTESKMDDMLVPMVRTSLRITVVVFVLVHIAQSLSDQPLTSIVASLGVGGLAVALAAQDTIKNFFGSLVIFADKPFELGDRIRVDGHDGPVEEVGFRSTRVRRLDGHLVTIPNGELANKTIENIGKRPYIKRTINIGITYDTAPDKVERAIAIMKELLADHEGMNADFPARVYFNAFNDSSLNIIGIYWYHPADYWAAQEFGEAFNLALLKRYNEEGIEFAFPTQTLYINSDSNAQLT